MVAKVLKSVAEVVGDYSGLSRKVLDYSLIMKQKVDEAKQPGFTTADWAPLAAMVATDDFERVGNFAEVMRWSDYVGFLTDWARTSEWECSFKRISESDNVVLLELEERSLKDGRWGAVSTMSVYEFDATGLLAHLDIYVQMPFPAEAMPDFYKEYG